MQVQSIPLQNPPEILTVATGCHQGGTENKYCHKFWTMHVPAWNGELVLNQRSFAVVPGCLILTPPHAQLTFAYGDELSNHVFSHFNCSGNSSSTVPIIWEASECSLCAWSQRFLAAFAWQPQRAVSQLWDMLWQASAACPYGALPETDGLHPNVRRAMEYIEAHLALPLSASEIADVIGISVNHLNRLFRADIQKTIWEHVVYRRMDQAFHLLCATTTPIVEVGQSCGYDNIQHFNKSVRQYHGRSPRTIRAQHGR